MDRQYAEAHDIDSDINSFSCTVHFERNYIPKIKVRQLP